MIDFTNPGLFVLIVGGVLFAFGILGMIYGTRKEVGMALTFLGAIALALVLIVAPASFTVAPQQAVPTPQASVQIGNFGGLTGVTVLNSTGDILQVAANVNTTSGAFVTPSSGSIAFHFKLSRTDVLTSTAIFKIVVVSPPTIYNSTKAVDEQAFMQYTSNKTSEYTVGVPGSSYTGSSAMVSVVSAGNVQINLTATLNPIYFTSMTLYSTQKMYVDIEDANGNVLQQVTVNLVHAVNTT